MPKAFQINFIWIVRRLPRFNVSNGEAGLEDRWLRSLDDTSAEPGLIGAMLKRVRN